MDEIVELMKGLLTLIALERGLTTGPGVMLSEHECEEYDLDRMSDLDEGQPYIWNRSDAHDPS